MRNAFLVSDDDLRSLRSGEPWSIELTGQAVFLHEGVLKLLMQQQHQQQQQQPHQPRSNLVPNVNGAYDAKGRSLTCDQPTCPRNLADRAFGTFAARQMHRAQTHGIPGEFAEKHKQYPRNPRKQLAVTVVDGLPIPVRPDIKNLIDRHNPASYQYMEFDAKGICGVGDCDYKNKKVKELHFHRSVKHHIRGINWYRTHKRSKKGKVKA